MDEEPGAPTPPAPAPTEAFVRLSLAQAPGAPAGGAHP